MPYISPPPRPGTYGPNHDAVAALIEQARNLTPAQCRALGAAYGAALGAAYDAAYGAALDAAYEAALDAAYEAAYGAAYGAALDAALDAAYGAAYGAALDAAYGAAYAARALVVRDIVSVEVFNILYGPWASIMENGENTMPSGELAYCTRGDHTSRREDFSSRANGRPQSWCRACTASYARERRNSGAIPLIPSEGCDCEICVSVPVRRERVPGRRNRDNVPTGPMGIDRPFGVEIECAFPGGESSMSRAAELLQDQGMDIEEQGYGHNVTTCWRIVSDSSVNRGFEVVSPILRGAEGRRELRRMLEALRTVGATVNRSCGFHVHHDAQDLTGAAFYRLVQLWQEHQAVIDGLVAPGRRGGSSEWCRRLDSNDIMDVRQLFNDIPTARVARSDASRYFGDPRGYARYRSLNFRVYSLYGTVEVRQHQGTLNATKALSWVLFGQAMLSYAIATADETSVTPATIEQLMTTLEEHGLESSTTAYLLDRHRRLTGSTVMA